MGVLFHEEGPERCFWVHVTVDKLVQVNNSMHCHLTYVQSTGYIADDPFSFFYLF